MPRLAPSGERPLSRPALGGWIAQEAGYPFAFELLGALALVSIVAWVAFAPVIRAVDGATEA